MVPEVVESRIVGWTTQDLVSKFRKAELTIINWRQNAGLPYIRIMGESRDVIRYDPEKVRKWAKKNGKTLYEDQETKHGQSGLHRVRVAKAAQGAAQAA